MTGQLIGLTGPARSGKDTAAAYLVERHGFTRVAFADPLRQFVAGLLGYDAEQMEHLKEEPVEWLNGATPRRMMQTIGTEWGRVHVDPDLWLKAAMRKALPIVEAGGRVVVTDARFENEAAAVRAAGGTVVHIDRPGCPTVAGHASEAGVAFGPADYRLPNSCGIDGLHRACEMLLSVLPPRGRPAEALAG